MSSICWKRVVRTLYSTVEVPWVKAYAKFTICLGNSYHRAYLSCGGIHRCDNSDVVFTENVWIFVDQCFSGDRYMRDFLHSWPFE